MRVPVVSGCLGLILAALFAVMLGCGPTPTEWISPTATPAGSTPTATPAGSTPTSLPGLVLTPWSSPTPFPTIVVTPTPTLQPRGQPTPAPTRVPTVTPAPNSTPVLTPTPKPTSTPVPTPTPQRDWKALLPHFEQYQEPDWYITLDRWNSLERFERGCRAGTLPKIPGTSSSLWVDGWGRLSSAYWGRTPSQRYPRPIYKTFLADALVLRTIHYPGKGDGGLGLMCIRVDDDVDIRLTCEGHPRAASDCTSQEPFILPPGYNFVLIHPNEGILPGRYIVEMRCLRPSDDCKESRIEEWFFKFYN